MSPPTICSCGADHSAAWIVIGPRGAFTACQAHLEQVKRKVGQPAELEPVQQPPGHDPPAEPEQPALF